MEPSTSSKRLRKDEDTENASNKRAKLELGDNASKVNEGRIISDGFCNQEDIRVRKKEESHFLRLFTTILNAIITIKQLNEMCIGQSIVSIRESFKFHIGPFSFSAIDFTKWKNICGYIYRYASHGAGFARFRILKAMRSCTLVEEVLKRSDLKIIFWEQVRVMMLWDCVVHYQNCIIPKV